MVGGELTLEALDLSYADQLGFYGAPVQIMANGGVLVIDDFGRQRCSPRELLNRWIVPLESRVDFLTLETGQKFDLPFRCWWCSPPTSSRPSWWTKRSCAASTTRSSPKARRAQEFTQIFEDCCRARELDVRPGDGRGTCSTRRSSRAASASAAAIRATSSTRRWRMPSTSASRAQLTAELLEAACAALLRGRHENAAGRG